MTYILNFAKNLGLSDLVVCVDSEDEAPPAEITKILRDTSVLPVDRIEVMHLEASASRQRMNESNLK